MTPMTQTQPETPARKTKSSETRPNINPAAVTPAPAAPAAKPSRISRRGFAAMDKSRQKQIASAGGRAAHERGHAHEFTSEEARQAGKKGGQSVSQNRQHMAAIGRKGGVARGERRKARMSGAVAAQPLM